MAWLSAHHASHRRLPGAGQQVPDPVGHVEAIWIGTAVGPVAELEEPVTGSGGLPDQADFRVVPGGGIANTDMPGAGLAGTRFITARAGHVKTVPPQFRGHILQPLIDGHVITQRDLPFASCSFTGTARLTASPAAGCLRCGQTARCRSRRRRTRDGVYRPRWRRGCPGSAQPPRLWEGCEPHHPRRQHDRTRRVSPHREAGGSRPPRACLPLAASAARLAGHRVHARAVGQLDRAAVVRVSVA